MQAFEAAKENHREKGGNGPELRKNLHQTVAVKKNAAYDAQIMGEGHNFADLLGSDTFFTPLKASIHCTSSHASRLNESF